MLFHTWIFLFFFILVFAGLMLLRSTRLWIPWLLLASYVFYGYWKPYYLVLLLYSTALDYYLVAWMDCSTRFGVRRRKIGLWLSILNNLSLLFFFKYSEFFVDQLNHLAAWVHLGWRISPPQSWMPFGWEYLLPVGISFYTFQSMSYTIDFYFGRTPREKSFLRFATFVSFFPQLVAGPIERASQLLPQFHHAPRITRQDLAEGLSLFIVGLFKKLALANALSLYVERVYGQVDTQSASALAMATFAFAWQIFFDFSGYTDMARGVGRMMGFRFMLNFNHPYIASGLGEFWARWHISLSTWFRDYVYIPLGGNRHGEWTTYRNLLITFVISGFWHGASWTFLTWGALHALGVMATRSLERSTFYRQRIPKILKQIAVFLFVCFAWIFFRAASMEEALYIVKQFFTGTWNDPQFPLLLLGLVMAVWTYQFLHESSWKQWLATPTVKITLVVCMVLYLFLGASSGGEFIYFQF